MISDITMIEELVVSFFAHVEAVGSVAISGTPGANELAVLVIDADGVATGARFVHRMGEIDPAMGVLCKAVGIAEKKALRWGKPIVDALIAMASRAENQAFGGPLCHGCCS